MPRKKHNDFTSEKQQKKRKKLIPLESLGDELARSILHEKYGGFGNNFKATWDKTY